MDDLHTGNRWMIYTQETADDIRADNSVQMIYTHATADDLHRVDLQTGNR